MDINTLRGILTLLLLLAFIGLCVWAYSRKRVDEFNEAANLPFVDEDVGEKQPPKQQTTNSDAQ